MSYLKEIKESGLITELERLGLVIAVDVIDRYHIIDVRKQELTGHVYFMSPSATKLHKENGKTDEELYDFFKEWVNKVIQSHKLA